MFLTKFLEAKLTNLGVSRKTGPDTVMQIAREFGDKFGKE